MPLGTHTEQEALSMSTTATKNSDSRRQNLTDEERAAKRAADREYAQQAVEALRTSEGWRRWLAVRASFHKYSVTNQLLIAIQHPTATYVTGFRNWLKLGYCVSKGQKGIRIWAPCPPSPKKIEAWRAAGADPKHRPKTFFRLTAVFAQDQVEELPPPAVPAPLDSPMRPIVGDDLAEYLPALARFGASIGSTVSFETVPGSALGYYRPHDKAIVIEASLSANQQVAILCHELAHALVAIDKTDSGVALNYASEELVVESIAFTVVGSLGIHTDPASIPYLASWAEKADLNVIQQTADLIDRIAKQLEDALAVNDQDDAEPLAA
jgi:antirestriction protein ArdC